MHVAIIGGTRGIGRATALNILSTSEYSVTILARNPEALSSDSEFSNHILSGRAAIVKGDAYDEESLNAFIFNGAVAVDMIVFAIGATYSSKRQFSLLRGFLLPSPDICTKAMLSLLRVLGSAHTMLMPGLVVISVIGLGETHRNMPLMHRIILPWLLQETIDDKRGVEALVSRAASSSNIHLDEPGLPSAKVLTKDTLLSIQEKFLPEVIILRPSKLVDEEGRDVGLPGSVDETASISQTSRGQLGRWIASEGMKKQWSNRKLVIGS